MALVNLSGVVGSYLTGWALRVASAPVLGLLCAIALLGLLLALRRQTQPAPNLAVLDAK